MLGDRVFRRKLRQNKVAQWSSKEGSLITHTQRNTSENPATTHIRKELSPEAEPTGASIWDVAVSRRVRR